MILTRSPFYYNKTVGSFDTSIKYNLTIGTGSTSSIVSVKDYEFTKLVPTTDTTNVFIDVSPMIRDYYSYSPLSFTGYTSPTVINSNEVLLAELTATIIDKLGNDNTPISNKYICTDGYGYYTEEQNKQSNNKILLSHTEYRAYENGFFAVPLSCNGSDADPTVNGVSVDLDYTDNHNNYVKYLIIPLGGFSGSVTVVFGGETIYIELIEECKFPVKVVQFINRFGVFETVHFYKASKETISVESKDFKNAYTNGLSYGVNKHQIKQYNKKTNKTVNIETGFLTPYYNETMQELLQSEFVWVDGKPVNVTSNSLELKTRVIDKLISYSIDFEYAYDEINNV